MNLRTKLLIPIIPVFLLFALSTHFYWRPIFLNMEKEKIVKREKDVLRNTVPGLIRSLLQGDLGAVYVTLDRMREINSKEGYQIELLNPDGKQLYPIEPYIPISSNFLLKLEQPLRVEHSLLGTLYVTIDWTEQYRHVEAQIWKIELMVLFLFGLTLLIILFLQEWFVSRPLIALKNASRELAEGNFKIGLPVAAQDEVGELARTFERMREGLLQSQEALERKAMEAEKANKAKSEFLSRMSHELRTPMNAILGFGQVLELDAANLTETQRTNVKEILEAGHHLLALINEVLDLARIESGKLEVAMEVIPVDEVIHQCIVLMQPQAQIRHVELVDQISNLGYSVKADFTRLKQVVLNLLSNAVKYNRDYGRITLDCEVVGDHRLRIRVTDTGAGLTADQLKKLFSPFERLNDSINVEGAGIGLVITKHLSELMGGIIGVESTPGEGSTFWVELALANNAAAERKFVGEYRQ